MLKENGIFATQISLFEEMPANDRISLSDQWEDIVPV